ncbi:uncharacterized protein BDZ99DRAFT_202264 [Mytilinidion resinicola]|uniref:Uncharacterized protein n=1 Tax=Mytilinidion resinicola TaxID=574789 RepID=A0A6A6Y171_9PEZI|nr:uncharacterized protein BDZ99DRAFT_202264 [Mytilinidion resinicola]KAF2802389.1 hypothetical protein BDZ99DRAFT_202264 [Mytilinidion resinicola]
MGISLNCFCDFRPLYSCRAHGDWSFCVFSTCKNIASYKKPGGDLANSPMFCCVYFLLRAILASLQPTGFFALFVFMSLLFSRGIYA